MTITKAQGKAVRNCLKALCEWLDSNDADRQHRGYDARLDDAASEAWNAMWHLEEFTSLLAAIDSEGR